MLRTILLTAAFGLGAYAAEESPAPAPDQALAMLMAGNNRYTTSHQRHPHEAASRRHQLTKSQHPYATILTCSDSRVPPELLFDAGLGDLFVIRVAGNIAADAVVGSIEYAVEHLGARLVLVMGHESCGAVQATISGGEPKTHIESLTKPIEPAVARAREQKGDLIANAVRENVSLVVDQLRKSQPILAERVEKGTMKVVGAVYHMDSGAVVVVP
jgi:carbonic anhydrase